MKKTLLILLFALGSTASAQQYKVNFNAKMMVSQQLEGGLQLRSAKCGFTSLEQLVCRIPITFPATVTGLGQPNNVTRDINLDAASELTRIIFYRATLDLYESVAILEIKDFETLEKLIYRSNPGIKGQAAQQKRQNFKRVLVTKEDLAGTDDFALNLQKSSFPEVFALFDSLLNEVVEKKMIKITAKWDPWFSNEATEAMVKSFCKTAAGQAEANCELLNSLK